MRALSFIREEKTLKIALIRKERHTFVIECLKKILSDVDVKPLYILASVLGQPAYTVATALDSWEVLFRKLSLPIGDKRRALAALPFQIETLLPYPLEETILAPVLKKIGKNATAADIFVTKESFLRDHLEWAKELEIDPDSVSCTPLALYRVGKWLFPQVNDCVLFYWGQNKSFCVCLNGGEIFLTQTLHIGIHKALKSLGLDFPEKEEGEWQEMAKDPHFFAEQATRLTHFEQFQKELKQELERLAIFLKNKQALSSNTPCLLLGDTFAPVGLSRIWSETISDVFLIPDETFPLSFADLHNFALPIGLGIDALADDEHGVQLRQGKWAPANQLSKRKKLAYSYAILCALLTGMMAIGGHLLLKKKENLLSQELCLQLPSTISKEDLNSKEEIRQKIREWEKMISSQKLAFPFLPNIPSASDFLAWLSTHPALTAADGGKKEGLEIKSLRYQIYKYPKLGESKDPYLAKVELEFTAASPRLAREFHDALLKGDVMVNPKQEIKWNVQNNTYFTSFELNALKKGGD